MPSQDQLLQGSGGVGEGAEATMTASTAGEAKLPHAVEAVSVIPVTVLFTANLPRYEGWQLHVLAMDFDTDSGWGILECIDGNTDHGFTAWGSFASPCCKAREYVAAADRYAVPCARAADSHG